MTDLKIADFGSLIKSEVVQLPSQEGTEEGVKLQKPPLHKLMHEGNVIDIVTPLVKDWTKVGATASNTEDDIEVVIQLLRVTPELEPPMNTVVAATMVEPSLTTEQGAKLSVGDRIHVLMCAL